MSFTYLTEDYVRSKKFIITDPRISTGAFDGFSRVRVSEPITLSELYSSYGKLPIDFEETLSGGTSTWDARGYVDLSVNPVAGAVVSRYTKEAIPYQSGKSRYFIGSAVMNMETNTSGCVSRVGSFDSSGGSFFEMVDGQMFVVERRDGIDSIRIPRASWNVDKMDGSGFCSINVDFNKGAIFTIDQEWLGVGIVRYGMFINGVNYHCHIITHEPDASGLDRPYYAMPKLPIRYEIRTTSAATGGRMRVLAGTVISESGYNSLANVFTQDNFGSIISIPSGNTQFCPVMAFRVRNTYPWSKTTMKIRDIEGLANAATTSNSGIALRVFLNASSSTNPTTWAVPWTNVDFSNSGVEYAINTTTTTTVSGGVILASTAFGAGSNVRYSMASDVVGSQPIVTTEATQDIIYIGAIPTSGTTVAQPTFIAFSWFEIQ